MNYLPTLDQQISDEAPCGIDLDSDPEALAFLTMAEGSLPLSFRDFDRKAFGDKAIIENVVKYLSKSHDIRLLVLAAKVFALTDNIAGFFESLNAASRLLTLRWAHFHPLPVSGDLGLRQAFMQSLDDRPTVILPLQAAPIIKDRRIGAVSQRSFLLAKKPALARSGEEVRDELTLRDALMRFEPLDELITLRGAFRTALENLQVIRSHFITHGGAEAAPSYELLTEYLEDVDGILSDAIQKREPLSPELVPQKDNAGEAGAGDEPAMDRGDIANPADVSAALDAVRNYFVNCEPSSPALLLVRQAQELVGKSFVDALQALAPDLAARARVELGSEYEFSLGFSKLQELAASETGAAVQAASGGLSVSTRKAAADVMKAVERFYVVHEPSSPVPLLLDRARRLLSRDFTSLLADLVKRD